MTIHIRSYFAVGMATLLLISSPAAGNDPRESAVRHWTSAFDRGEGGFGTEPKFPQPVVLTLLLHEAVRGRDKALLAQVTHTLDRMAASGLRDQLGGAFHRHAEDRAWRVPHFGVTLGDNAALAILYLEAWQATRNPDHAAVARGILDDLLRRFALPDGAFAAANDSESEEREGRYYTWTEDEVRAVLPAAEAKAFIAAYLDGRRGLIDGRVLPRLAGAAGTLARTESALADARARLLDARSRREAPKVDDRVLTSWNALAVSAFAKGGRILGEERYRKVARSTMVRLMEGSLWKGRLSHVRRGGVLTGETFLEDYALTAQALLDLYETDFDHGWLDEARRVAHEMLDLFQPEPGAPPRDTPVDARSGTPSPRVVLAEDGAMSGAAAALTALNRLALLGAGTRIENEARDLMQALDRPLAIESGSAPGLGLALDFRSHETREVVIVGIPESEGTRAMVEAAHARLLPGVVLTAIDPDHPPDPDIWPLLAPRPMKNGLTTAYVCRNMVCDMPVTTVKDFTAILDGANGR
ncbi:MAG: hypothetical protein H7840_00520 [Alphaproteobacteria bacterium]